MVSRLDFPPIEPPSGPIVVAHTTPPAAATAHTVRNSADNIGCILRFIPFLSSSRLLTSLIVLIILKIHYFFFFFLLEILLEYQSTPQQSALESVFSRNRGLRRRQRRKTTTVCVWEREREKERERERE
jgi:hypothetical protein